MIIDTDILKETVENLFAEKIKGIASNESLTDKLKDSLRFSQHCRLGQTLYEIREFETMVEKMMAESNGEIKIK